MLTGPHNFFFDAFDPAGFVSLDKPPVAFWVQVLSAKVFGFSVLLPQLLEGLAAIVVLYYLVRRRFGEGAALLAALALAVTPVSVQMDRGSGTDSCLVLVLLLAAWAVGSAVQSGRAPLFWASMALVGLGFNVKMAEALGVVPAFAAVYSVAAPGSLRRRLRDVVIGFAILAAVSLSWPAIFDLTPAADRPFAGSSTHNSMVELAAVYNGIDRFIPRARFAPVREAGAAGAGPLIQRPGQQQRAAGGVGRRPGFMGGGAPAGPLRLFTPGLAAEAGWLLPFAAVAVFATFFTCWRRRFAGPLSPRQIDVVLWGGWALCYGIVYSAAGGMFRPYYLVTLAPPLAALAAIGATALWARSGDHPQYRYALVGALLSTALWQLYVMHGLMGPGAARVGFRVGAPAAPSSWQPWLYGPLACGTLAAVAGLLFAGRRRVRAAIGVGLAMLLVAPATSSLGSVFGRTPFVMAPAAAFAAGASRTTRRPEPGVRFGFGQTGSDQRLVAFLRANRHGERFLLATASAMQAAPIIIATGEPIMAMGGFTGRDPILTVEGLSHIVEAGELRFVIVGGAHRFGDGPGAPSPLRFLVRWVQQHGRPVDPSVWRPSLLMTGIGVRGGCPKVS
jgi:4-amino-4-deoxy-L-arabinose transferase-like glycosyltransferase